MSNGMSAEILDNFATRGHHYRKVKLMSFSSFRLPACRFGEMTENRPSLLPIELTSKVEFVGNCDSRSKTAKHKLLS